MLDPTCDLELAVTSAGPPDALSTELAALRAEVAALRDATGAAAESSSSALEDVRGSLEARLAVLEDALDGLSERLEALARDGARTTTSLLQSLTDTVRAGQEQAAKDRETTQELVRAVRAAVDAIERLDGTIAAPRTE